MDKKLIEIYKILFNNFGRQHWWPAKGRKERKFEICIGAILTQNTSWKNAEKAIENLREAGALSEKAIEKIPQEKIALLIKPAGYYNQKAKKLKAFAGFLEKNSFEKLGKMPINEARQLLLEVHGIGKETADSMLLYALNKPIFIIDAYTKRIFERIFSMKFKDYDEWQRFFSKSLRRDTLLFNEYHALIVALGKDVCRKRPLCEKCPVQNKCNAKF